MTVEGTLTAVELLARWIKVPPLGDTPLRLTDPFEAAPPDTLIGFKVSAATLRGTIVNPADCDTPFMPAVMVAVVWTVTEEVETEKEAEL